MEPLIINACLTGNVPMKSDTPYVPITPEEIIADAEKVMRIGATVLHLHARNSDGTPTYKKEVFSKIIKGIRSIEPGVIICVTTSGRAYKDFKKRTDVLELKGDAKPDFASLTLGSLNFPKQAVLNDPEMIIKIAMKMKEKGIQAEWEVFEPGMLHYGKYLVQRGILNAPRWINFLLGSLGTSPATPEIFSLLVSMAQPLRWAATGVGRYQLDINSLAIENSGHVRVGIEDSIYMDKGKTKLATNSSLVKRIVAIAKMQRRPIATLEQARKLLLGN